MPSPRRRTKRFHELSDAQIAEILAGGPAPGTPSAFAIASEFLDGRARLAADAPTWSSLDRFSHEGRAHRIRFARHMAEGHEGGRPFPEYPAALDLAVCPQCHR